MIDIRTFAGIASSTVALSASVAAAQLTSFTITDGTVSFTLDGIVTNGDPHEKAVIAHLRLLAITLHGVHHHDGSRQQCDRDQRQHDA